MARTGGSCGTFRVDLEIGTSAWQVLHDGGHTRGARRLRTVAVVHGGRYTHVYTRNVRTHACPHRESGAAGNECDPDRRHTHTNSLGGTREEPHHTDRSRRPDRA